MSKLLITVILLFFLLAFTANSARVQRGGAVVEVQSDSQVKVNGFGAIVKLIKDVVKRIASTIAKKIADKFAKLAASALRNRVFTKIVDVADLIGMGQDAFDPTELLPQDEEDTYYMENEWRNKLIEFNHEQQLWFAKRKAMELVINDTSHTTQDGIQTWDINYVVGTYRTYNKKEYDAMMKYLTEDKFVTLQQPQKYKVWKWVYHDNGYRSKETDTFNFPPYDRKWTEEEIRAYIFIEKAKPWKDAWDFDQAELKRKDAEWQDHLKQQEYEGRIARDTQAQAEAERLAAQQKADIEREAKIFEQIEKDKAERARQAMIKYNEEAAARDAIEKEKTRVAAEALAKSQREAAEKKAQEENALQSAENTYNSYNRERLMNLGVYKQLEATPHNQRTDSINWRLRQAKQYAWNLC